MQSTQYTSSSSSNLNNATVERVLLPTQVIEKPVAIHEEIRREMVEEIQPVINVEKLKTEVHQVTQPLFDKEVRPVQIENRTLATEVLPEVLVAGRGVNMANDVSTTKYLDTTTVVVEKPAQFREVERRQIIEEIQPVIYKETVVPSVIQETKPVYQKIVEGPVYTQSTLAAQGVSNPSMIAPAYVPDNTPRAAVNERVMLPTQVVEKPVAIHETIQKEVLEEIQPVVNVEKLKTEIHQITVPLYDKEVRAVDIQQRTLNTEILPEVLVEGRGVRAIDDVSSVNYQATNTVVIEKPAQFREVERTQIIEEIQPVIYKETVVPHVIKETKPVYQKIVEGPVYTQQTLPAQSLQGSGYSLPNMANLQVREVAAPVVLAPVVAAPAFVSIPIVETSRAVPIAVVQPVVAAPLPPMHRKEIIEDTISTTTTTTIAPVVGANMGGAYNGASAAPHNTTQHKGLSGIFHRHGHDAAHDNTTTSRSTTTTSAPALGPYGTSAAPLHPVAAPLGSSTQNAVHTEKVLPNGAKVVEDTITSTTHSARTVNRI